MHRSAGVNPMVGAGAGVGAAGGGGAAGAGAVAAAAAAADDDSGISALSFSLFSIIKRSSLDIIQTDINGNLFINFFNLL